jgi:hypothetical protein
MSVDLFNTLDKRVVAVGEFMVMSDEMIVQGRADAKLIAETYPDLHGEDVWVSLAWKKKFPKRNAYGEAFGAALTVAGTTWRVANRLYSATNHMNEADFIARPLVRSDSLFTFMHITRKETLSDSIEMTQAQIAEPETPVTAWDYLCFAASEPEVFESKLFVAVGDNVPMVHSEECHSPALQLRGNRLVVSAILKKSRPNGTTLYHMVAKPLTV